MERYDSDGEFDSDSRNVAVRVDRDDHALVRWLDLREAWLGPEEA